MILNDQDLAIIVNKLQVPLIVSELLDAKTVLTSDTKYALHELISNFKPDMALISIAISIRKIITTQLNKTSASIKILEMECDKIIDEYGVLCFKEIQSEKAIASDVFNSLIYMGEDFESLTNLLDSNAFLLQEQGGVAFKLYEILRVQAKTQSMVVETALMMVNIMEDDEKDNMISAPVADLIENCDNVIIFPF
ncbi:MAG: hypothetical protein KAJ86_00550 [Alphaproteobacteria bacterium]|nr:hypothetical protein [Alphaproteobacteria bacterium]